MPIATSQYPEMPGGQDPADGLGRIGAAKVMDGGFVWAGWMDIVVGVHERSG